MVGLIAPAVSFAQESQMKRPAPAAGDMAMMPERQFSCDSIDTMRASTLTKLSERATTFTGASTNRRTEMESQKNSRIATLEDARTKGATQREARYDAMRAKATTDAQKAAVETFVTTVEALVDDREAAVDAAIATFEAGVQSLRGTQEASAADLADNVEDSLEKVFDDAKAACTESSTAASVRTEIMEGMQAMKTAHQAERETYSFKTEFEALRATRQSAEKAAMAAFAEGFQKATDTLKSSVTY